MNTIDHATTGRDRDVCVRVTCPACSSHDIVEHASIRLEYPVTGVSDGRPESADREDGAEAEFDSFVCRGCSYESEAIGDFVAPDPGFEPEYQRWRHGGWYVIGVRHRNGGVGCVSRSHPDRRWRIVCDSRNGDHTYKSRDEAARAEYALTLAGVIE